jgi:hypothetical protein
LTEQRLNLPELLSLVCAGQNIVQYARKFRDFKRFVLEDFLLDDELVSDEDIEVFLQQRGYSVARNKFNSELKQLSMLSEYGNFDQSR